MGRYDQVKDKKNAGAVSRVIIVLSVLAGVGWFYFNYRQNQAVIGPRTQALALPSTPGESGATDSLSIGEAADGTALAEVGADNIIELKQDDSFILPDLDNSDALLREEIAGISSGLAGWLNADQLIRKYVVMINDFSQGLRLEKHMRFLKPDQPFAVDLDNGKIFIAGKSYQRYESLAAAINALDIPATLAVYKKFRPLVLQVFREFSYPEEYSPEDIFIKAAAVILAAPVIEGQIALVRHSEHYRFAEQQLEALNPIQKQMLRMGPENTRIIQNKLRSLVEALVNLKE